MSEIEARPARSGSPLPLVGIGVLLLVGIAVLAYFRGGSGIPGLSGSAIKQVGSLDQEAVFTMPEFEKAKKDMEKLAADTEKKFEDKAKALGENPSQEQQRAFEKELREGKLELQKKSNETLNPLKTRAEYAVAQVAAAKGMTVVLDKRIIVYGVPEITDEVKKAFESAKPDAKVSDPPDSSNAPIGYFDQEVVRTLKVFQETEMQLLQKRQELAKEFEEKTKGMSNADRELLERQLKLKLESYQEQLTTPLVTAVNESVKEVAQAEGLSLVLDKQHVMQGGRNMTDKVVETFLKKVGGSKAPADGATPGAGPATPAEASK